MRALIDGRHFSAVAIAALLSGCGGSSPATTPGGVFNAVQPGSKKFKYTGHEQRFVVPSGVTTLSIRLLGARGAGWSVYYTNFPALYGSGGRVDAEIPVKPGETLYVNVGGHGGYGVGGFNGGGNSGTGSGSHYEGAAGGGETGVKGSPPGYGGGGGSQTQGGAGGGGGSSYVEPSAIKSRMWQAWKNATGNGLVVFTWQ